MSRSERLLILFQGLCAHCQPVSAQAFANELGVSIRTPYRDIVRLQGREAMIEGEASVD
ncbi:HTH domain-containing protein [Pseudomonas sp. 1152_12]